MGNHCKVIKSLPLRQPCPRWGLNRACDAWNYPDRPDSKLTSSYRVIAIRGCHSGGGGPVGKPPWSVSNELSRVF